MAGHVQRVRDVGDQAGVALIRVPGLLRRLAAFVGVNQIVMRAELQIVFRDDFFEQCDRFERVRTRLLGGRLEAVVEREAEHRLRVQVVGIGGDQTCAESVDVRCVGGVARSDRAPRGL